MIKLEKYRDTWLAEKFDDFIGFYTREFYCLDNFSAYSIEYKGKFYPTSEHAYQASKFFETDIGIAERIRNARSPYGAKLIAVENQDKINPKWQQINVEVMEEILRAKLTQFDHVKRKLLETKDYLICEDSPYDNFWGIGPARDGQNQLGKLWMKLREELLNN